MGTSRSVKQLNGKLLQLERKLPQTRKAAVQQAAVDGREMMIDGAQRAGLRRGAPFPAQTRRGQPAKKTWNVKVTITGGDTVRYGYVGPVHWVEGGTKAHMIVPRNARQRVRKVGKNGPSKKQQEQGEVLFGFLAGGGGGGVTITKGRLRIGGPPGGRGDVVAGAVQHKGSRARPFWHPTKNRTERVIIATYAKHQSKTVQSIFT